MAMLTENDIKHIRRLIEKNSFRTRLGISIAVVFVVIWLFLGFVIPWVLSPGPNWRQDAANIGDMFGVVNSLFSGLALFGVVAALFLQMREMRINERSHREQLEIAQKTARVQALTFLADLHAKQMENAPQHFGTMFKENAAYCANRAVELIRDLGETFPEAPERGIKVSFFSRWDYAAMRLRQIYDMYFYGYRLFIDKNEKNNAAPCHYWQQVAKMLEEWFAVYEQELEHNALFLRHVMTDAAELSSISLDNPLLEGSPLADDADSKAQWDNFWSRCVHLDRTFTRGYKVFLVATREHNQAAQDFDR